MNIFCKLYFQTHTFVCFDEENYQEFAKFTYYPYGLSISCVFLTITLAVYLSLPKVSLKCFTHFVLKNSPKICVAFSAIEFTRKNIGLLRHFIPSSIYNTSYYTIQTRSFRILPRSWSVLISLEKNIPASNNFESSFSIPSSLLFSCRLLLANGDVFWYLANIWVSFIFSWWINNFENYK